MAVTDVNTNAIAAFCVFYITVCTIDVINTKSASLRINFFLLSLLLVLTLVSKIYV